MVKNLPANTGDPRDKGSTLGLRWASGVGNGHPLQYSCLKNSMDRRAWWAIVRWVAESNKTEHTWTHTHTNISVNLNISKVYFLRYWNLMKMNRDFFSMFVNEIYLVLLKCSWVTLWIIKQSPLYTILHYTANTVANVKQH